MFKTSICGVAKGGFFIRGPWGFSLATGYYHSLFGSAAGVTAAGVGVAASVVTGCVVYFVPWARVFDYVYVRCKRFWDKICTYVSYIRDKLVDWVSTAASTVVLTAWHIAELLAAGGPGEKSHYGHGPRSSGFI